MVVSGGESVVVCCTAGAGPTFASCVEVEMMVEVEVVDVEVDDIDVDVDVTKVEVVVVLSEVVEDEAACTALGVAWTLPPLPLLAAVVAALPPPPPGFGTAVHLLPLMLVMNWPEARLALVDIVLSSVRVRGYESRGGEEEAG